LSTNSYRWSHSRFYYSLRLYFHKKQRFLRVAQFIRGSVLLGPLRTAVVHYYKTFRPNKPFATELTAVFPFLNADQIVNRINEFGYAHVGNLEETYVDQILDYCRANRRIRYWNPHRDCQAIDRISRDARIIEIVRKYLGVEPILWLSELRWRLEDPVNLRPSIHVEAENYPTRNFHYDVHDVKSLTLFVYLTDCDMDSFPHVIIEGTHKRKTLKELQNRFLDEDVAQKRYGNRINVILGPKGTAFLEDTTSFHKVGDGTKQRLILSIQYVFRRGIPPGRPVRES
jgi:hypothetical protein